MKRDIEQIWFKDRLPHVGGWFVGLKYLGPDAFPKLWKAELDTEMREVAIKVKLPAGWRTLRVPMEFVVMYRGAPTKAEPDTAPSDA